jgi:hypothetical protein
MNVKKLLGTKQCIGIGYRWGMQGSLTLREEHRQGVWEQGVEEDSWTEEG